jgi:GDP/UDP-N,N'-diacetylbacillosamine 2-epimerase (hydrolysing)
VRRICAFSGKRGGFGAFLPLMRRVEADPELELLVLLADQHASARFGRSADEVRAALPDAELELVEIGTGRDDSARLRAESLGRCLEGVAGVLHRRRPEAVLVHGDRGEHLVVALAAVTQGIAVAHTQGGERSGNVDEIQRHAISKLAHLHFPETEEAAERLRRMGEDDWRIHVVGSTYPERIVAGLYPPAEEARRAVGLGAGERFLLVLVHPESFRSAEENRRLAEAVLAGARATGLRCVATYPAADPGYEAVVEALTAAADDGVVVRPNLDQDVYLGLMAAAEALVGNSSAALVEAPWFGLPAVNVGRRQGGRERDANVVDADETPGAIAAALERARSPEFREAARDAAPRRGDGRASERILEVLRATPLDRRLLAKELTY